MGRKRLCKVVGLTSVKRRGQAVVAENYVYDGDQLVAEMNAAGAIQHEYFDGSSLDQVFADQTVIIGVLWLREDLTRAARDVTMTNSSAVCHGMRTTAIFPWVCCLQEL